MPITIIKRAPAREPAELVEGAVAPKPIGQEQTNAERIKRWQARHASAAAQQADDLQVVLRPVHQAVLQRRSGDAPELHEFQGRAA